MNSQHVSLEVFSNTNQEMKNHHKLDYKEKNKVPTYPGNYCIVTHFVVIVCCRYIEKSLKPGLDAETPSLHHETRAATNLLSFLDSELNCLKSRRVPCFVTHKTIRNCFETGKTETKIPTVQNDNFSSVADRQCNELVSFVFAFELWTLPN